MSLHVFTDKLLRALVLLTAEARSAGAEAKGVERPLLAPG